MKILLCIIAFAFLVGCQQEIDEGLPPDAANEEEEAPGQVEEHGEIEKSDQLEEEIQTIIAEHLNIPWSIEEWEGIFYLTEREGQLIQIENEQKKVQELLLSSTLYTEGESGVQGFVLDPHFASNQEAFLYYTYQERSAIYNKIVKIELDSEAQRWEEIDILLEEIPGARFHNGGRLKIGPDHKLYATAGDANEAIRAQDEEDLAGTILRLNLDGSIPDDNPRADSYVYSYGHRNPQGLTWTAKAQLFSSEHGPSGHDELNLIMPDHNYGWPVIHGSEEQEGLQAPIIHSGSGTWAPSGIAYAEGYIYFAGLRGEGVFRYHIENGQLEQIIEGYGRIRDVLVLDDALYFITNNLDGRGAVGQADDLFVRVKLVNE